MFSVGVNHFCTHIGLAPLRKFAGVNADPKMEHRISRIEPKIIDKHESAYQKLGFNYMDEDDDPIDESHAALHELEDDPLS